MQIIKKCLKFFCGSIKAADIILPVCCDAEFIDITDLRGGFSGGLFALSDLFLECSDGAVDGGDELFAADDGDIPQRYACS